MTTRRFFAIAALGATIVTSAQAWSWGFGERVKGSGEIATETRTPGAFDGISLSGSFKVIVRQAGANKVELKTDNNLLPYIETKIVESSKGRTLEVSTKRGVSIDFKTAPLITIDVAQLRAVSIAGSGDVKVETMKTQGVDASIAGSGNIVFDKLDSERLGVKVSGSGDVIAAGRTGQLNISVAGSGDVKTRGLEAEDVKVTIAGSGDAQVQASKKLNVSIAGSGDVAYLGSPEISSSIAGSGRIKKINN